MYEVKLPDEQWLLAKLLHAHADGTFEAQAWSVSCLGSRVRARMLAKERTPHHTGCHDSPANRRQSADLKCVVEVS